MPEKMIGLLRNAALKIAITAAASTLVLTACSLPSGKNPNYPHDAPVGGQTIVEMEQSVVALPGIESVETQGHNSLNIKGNTGRHIKVVIEPGYVVADEEAFATFLVESLWSVREGYMPNASLQLSITANPEDEFSIGAAVIAAGWREPDAHTRPPTDEGWSSTAVDVSERTSGSQWGIKNLERLGDWPGTVPEPPTDALVPRDMRHDRVVPPVLTRERVGPSTW